MPIYMDLHIVPGVDAKAVAAAHSRDVYLEKDHNCKCLTYWVDELRGHVFCLIDAPSKEHVHELHNRSHGLTPHKIIEVQTGFVESFLGRITDPESGEYTNDGLLILDDTSYRIILFVSTMDAGLQPQLDMGSANKKAAYQQRIIRSEIKKQQGKETIFNSWSIIGSFISAEKAFNCALSIDTALGSENYPPISMAIHAGEPVAKTDELFGDTLQLLKKIQLRQTPQKIAITAAVKELLSKDMLQQNAQKLWQLSVADQTLLEAVFEVLEKNYTDENFEADKYASALALSKSQLYRRIIALTGYSPNELLKTFRLEKALELLRKKQHNISEISFATGFSSPSYFSKCFKTTFGTTPLDYQKTV